MSSWRQGHVCIQRALLAQYHFRVHCIRQGILEVKRAKYVTFQLHFTFYNVFISQRYAALRAWAESVSLQICVCVQTDLNRHRVIFMVSYLDVCFYSRTGFNC